MIRDALQVVGHFHGGDDEPQVGGDRLEPDENAHAALVDLALEFIDIRIVGDDGAGEVDVALEQGVHGALEVLAGEAGHREDLGFQGVHRLVELAENVLLVHRGGKWGGVTGFRLGE